MAPSTIATAALAYAAKGWRVIPLHSITNGKCSCNHEARKGTPCPAAGKHPRLKDWADEASSDKAQVATWWTTWPNANVGIAFGQGMIDIELDTKNGKNGPATIAELEKRLGKLPATYTWRSGGGGLHRIYLTDMPLRGGIEALGDGVDVLSDGRQAVAPPSTHLSGKRYVHVDQRAPVLLPRAWRDELRMEQDVAGASTIDILDRDPSATTAEAEALLAVVPADDYDVWLKVGMALRHQWQDTDEEDDARAVWERWSSKSAKYNAAEIEERWHGFNGGGAGWVTFGSIRWLSKDHGGKTRIHEDKAPAVVVAESAKTKKQVLAAIAAAECVADLYEAAKLGRAVEMTSDDTNDLVRALRTKSKALGEVMNKEEAKALVTFDRRGWFLTRAKALAWHETLYLQTGMKPALLEQGDTMVEHSRESFNATYGYKLTAGTVTVGGGKAQAVDEPWNVAVNLTDDEGAPLLPRVNGWGYKPGSGRVFRGPAGGMLANSWAPWDRGTSSMLCTAQEDGDILLWQKHLRWMIGDESAALLTQFLAWTVQRPHQRVRWCFTVLGPEGNGKSMVVHELMRNVLGVRNVSIVGPSDLCNPQYNGWMNAGAVGCIDELHVETDSAKEFAVVNALKPAITDAVLKVSDKYRKAVTVDNVTTWYATSNFMVPFRLQGDTGRRWYFARCQQHTVAEIAASLGGKVERLEYFKALAKAAHRSSAALRGWLASVPLAGFDPNHAPECAHIATMMAASQDPLAVLTGTALDESGSVYVSREVVGIKFLMAQLEGMSMDSRISERVVARKLADMGYRVALTGKDPWATNKVVHPETRTTWYTKQGTSLHGEAQMIRDLVAANRLL